jgi:GDP-L-fucose synthase
MPTNLYGPGDNYDLNHSHVLPALIRKMHEAKERNDEQVIVWGTGVPLREFLYSDDMAEACVFLMELSEAKFAQIIAKSFPPLINIGSGTDISIKELAELVKDVIDFRGELVFDRSKPDGTMRKLMDVSKLNQIGWRATTQLRDGIAMAYKSYLGK